MKIGQKSFFGTIFDFQGKSLDDLATFFIFTPKTMKKIKKRINSYLKEVQKWLCKWKMKMSALKCNYSVFSQNRRQISTFNFNLQLFNIPRTNNPTFLGVTFDSFLCFNKHIENVLSKAQKYFQYTCTRFKSSKVKLFMLKKNL